MEAIIAWAWPYLLAAGATVLGVWGFYSSGKQSGIEKERATHAARERENLERIKRAADARPTGGVQQDPHNRDR